MKNVLLNLTGQTFGIWKVLYQAPRRDNKTRWICECSVCGITASHRSTALRKGAFAHCDGRHLRRLSAPSPLRKRSGYAAATEVYRRIQTGAKRRGFPFSLSRNEFDLITASNCWYCGAPPSNQHSRRHFYGTFIYNGIDRLDSLLGYEVNNCVACCATCNIMKQDLLPAEFLLHIEQIYRHHHYGAANAATPPRMAINNGAVVGKEAIIDLSCPPERAARIARTRELKAAGKNLTQIGEILGLSRTTAWRAVNGYPQQK
jgi:hypothetical protein